MPSVHIKIFALLCAPAFGCVSWRQQVQLYDSVCDQNLKYEDRVAMLVRGGDKLSQDQLMAIVGAERRERELRRIALGYVADQEFLLQLAANKDEDLLADDAMKMLDSEHKQLLDDLSVEKHVQYEGLKIQMEDLAHKNLVDDTEQKLYHAGKQRNTIANP